jgi:hypothetical protein
MGEAMRDRFIALADRDSLGDEALCWCCLLAGRDNEDRPSMGVGEMPAEMGGLGPRSVVADVGASTVAVTLPRLSTGFLSSADLVASDRCRIFPSIRLTNSCSGKLTGLWIDCGDGTPFPMRTGEALR